MKCLLNFNSLLGYPDARRAARQLRAIGMMALLVATVAGCQPATEPVPTAVATQPPAAQPAPSAVPTTTVSSKVVEVVAAEKLLW